MREAIEGGGAEGVAFETALGCDPADRGDTGVGVLEVVDGVLGRLPRHEVEVERRRLVDRRHERQEAGGVGAELVDEAREGDVVAGTLRHPAADERHELAEADLEAVTGDAERLDAGIQARHLTVVVGPEDVDDPVEAPLEELVAVVGEVSRQVGRIAVRLDEHAVAGVAEAARAQPDGSVLVEDVASLAKAGDGVGDLAALLDGGLGEPFVELDAHRLERLLDVGEDPVGGETAGLHHLLGAVVALREIGDVLALVAALADHLATPPGEQALAELADLAAGVVHVVLAGDERPRPCHDAGEGVPVGAEPAVADVQRAGRVGRDELDLHPLAVAELRSAIAVGALLYDLAEDVVQPGGRQPEVHEAGPGHLHLLHLVEAGVVEAGGVEAGGELGGELAGLAAVSLCEDEGGIGREVAVLGALRTLEVDFGRVCVDAETRERARDCGGEALDDGHGSVRMAEAALVCNQAGIGPAGRRRERRLPHALVAQRIEHRPPEPGAQVRVLPRAPGVSDKTVLATTTKATTGHRYRRERVYHSAPWRAAAGGGGRRRAAATWIGRRAAKVQRGPWLPDGKRSARGPEVREGRAPSSGPLGGSWRALSLHHLAVRVQPPQVAGEQEHPAKQRLGGDAAHPPPNPRRGTA